MIRGTTPDYILTLDADLTDKTVYVTVAQSNKIITKTGDDLAITVDTSGETPVSEIAFWMTQEDTLSLREGAADIQVKYIDANGVVSGTEIASIVVKRTLLERVITYAADD